MTDDKPRKMAVPKSTPPGTELDAHGNPIPFEKKTQEDKQQSAAAAAVTSSGDTLADFKPGQHR
jgi:hypothetical protein